MATFRLVLAVPYLATNNAAKMQKSPTDQRKEEVLTDVGNLCQEIAGGKRQTYSGQTPPSLILTLDQNATAATGQVVFDGSTANNDTIQVGGITFTGKTGTPSGSTQFKCGVSATADGAAFAAAVNTHTTTNLYVSASNASGTVTLTAIGNAIGLLGNGIILSASDNTHSTVTAFANGAEDTGKQTYSF